MQVEIYKTWKKISAEIFPAFWKSKLLKLHNLSKAKIYVAYVLRARVLLTLS